MQMVEVVSKLINERDPRDSAIEVYAHSPNCWITYSTSPPLAYRAWNRLDARIPARGQSCGPRSETPRPHPPHRFRLGTGHIVDLTGSREP
jgi:hypothetical protein